VYVLSTVLSSDYSPDFIYDQSIGVNPTVANIDINNAATNWLWAVFAIMLASTLAFLFRSWRRPIGTRLFHQLPLLILTTASVAYFSMASDLGSAAVRAEFPRGATPGVTRSIWVGSLTRMYLRIKLLISCYPTQYVRYIDWAITTPLLLLELLLATGLPLSDILTVLFMDLVMIVTGLVGALVPTRYKWGYFAMGCAALFYIWWVLLAKGSKAAFALGADMRSIHLRSGQFTALALL
jgi:bacteriorhodopsin